MDFIEERRFEFDSTTKEGVGSGSAAEKDRFRLGERKELGDSEGCRGFGDG
jgi:hypothetical protein